MARMHSRRKGKSGSSKPLEKVKPAWVKLETEEIVKLILKLAKEGKSSAKIGLLLRDQYSVPDVKIATGKSINKILGENNALPGLPYDIQDLLNHAVKVRKHLDSNKKDKHSFRGLQLIESKIWRLSKYYRRTGVLPKDWKYDPTKIQT